MIREIHNKIKKENGQEREIRKQRKRKTQRFVRIAASIGYKKDL